ncbi:hypothetical protein C2845_PM07G09090 [Panicum miliaceum]|uniref:Secreted protein n=1 Tax=Panicum miliaceum TaxID=4540 RepID=A0A3L6SQ34_PANMI|nr:hypothetical protein C2845_PM07G09090 [Panicum miliaceum]
MRRHLLLHRLHGLLLGHYCVHGKKPPHTSGVHDGSTAACAEREPSGDGICRTRKKKRRRRSRKARAWRLCWASLAMHATSRRGSDDGQQQHPRHGSGHPARACAAKRKERRKLARPGARARGEV